jgi:hypothetical protein
MRAPAALILAGMFAATAATAHPREELFTKVFPLSRCGGFSSTGENEYWVLQPGHTLKFEGDDDGELVELTITVLNETITIAGVETRIVEERESKDGELVEVSRNYFAFCNESNSAFYFGEDVDFYEDGVIVDHEGTWRAGVAGAKAGMQMPGLILLGSGYYQEVAPGIALDRARIITRSAVLATPAGTFTNVLVTEEDSALNPGRIELKYYAKGIGLIKDAELDLIEVIPAP